MLKRISTDFFCISKTRKIKETDKDQDKSLDIEIDVDKVLIVIVNMEKNLENTGGRPEIDDTCIGSKRRNSLFSSQTSNKSEIKKIVKTPNHTSILLRLRMLLLRKEFDIL